MTRFEKTTKDVEDSLELARRTQLEHVRRKPKEKRYHATVHDAFEAVFKENQQLKAKLALYDSLMLRIARLIEESEQREEKK